MSCDGYDWTLHPLVGWCWYRRITPPPTVAPPAPVTPTPAVKPEPVGLFDGPNGEAWNSTRYHEVWGDR